MSDPRWTVVGEELSDDAIDALAEFLIAWQEKKDAAQSLFRTTPHSSRLASAGDPQQQKRRHRHGS